MMAESNGSKWAKVKAKRQQKVMNEWDMLSNVMTTRNELPTDHPSYLSKAQVGEYIANEVVRQTGQPMPDVFQEQNKPGTTVSTGGGWQPDASQNTSAVRPPVHMKVTTSYMQKAMDDVRNKADTTKMNNLVRTFQHELRHVEQRHDQAFMESSDKPVREFQGFATMVIPHGTLPQLEPTLLAKKKVKAQAHFQNMQEVHKQDPVNKRLKVALDNTK